MRFVVDYHFHPNLPNQKSKAISKCLGWWKAFRKHGINAVIVTEHNYKNPDIGYKMMAKTKPKGCFVFPGLEYETKEWIDVIIFSDNENIYSNKELKHSTLSYKELVKLVKKKKLHAFLPHPYIIGLTSIIKIKGHNFYKKAVEEIGAVEIVNTCLDNLKKVVSLFPLNIIFRNKLDWMKKVHNLPKSDYPKKIKFLAAGSDAHFYEELGTGVILDTEEKELFKTIISNKSPRIIIKKSNFSPLLLLKTLWSVISEVSIKRTQ